MENKNEKQWYNKDPKEQESLRHLWESIGSEIMEKFFPRNLEGPEKSFLQTTKSLKIVELISPAEKDQPYKSFVFVLSSLLTFKSYTDQIQSLMALGLIMSLFVLFGFWFCSHQLYSFSDIQEK